MTKNIKLVEQESLSKQFHTFKLNNLFFLTLSNYTDIVKASKMQPIEGESMQSFLE
jgi:hypothetical protein